MVTPRPRDRSEAANWSVISLAGLYLGVSGFVHRSGVYIRLPGPRLVERGQGDRCDKLDSSFQFHLCKHVVGNWNKDFITALNYY